MMNGTALKVLEDEVKRLECSMHNDINYIKVYDKSLKETKLRLNRRKLKKKELEKHIAYLKGEASEQD